MSRVVIETNLEKALKQLREAGGNVKEVEKDALLVAGEAIQERAVGYAPSPTSSMFPTESTGMLRDSHTLTVGDNKAVIQPQVHYAVYVHEGHFTAYKFVKGEKPTPRGTRKFIPPRPWLYHAAQDSKRDIVKLLTDLVQTALEEAVGTAHEA